MVDSSLNEKDASYDITREILGAQLDAPSVTVTFRTLFRYASKQELCVIFLSASCAAISGAVLPLMTLVLGSLAGQFTGFQSGSVPVSKFEHDLSQLALYFVYLGIGAFVTVFCTIQGFSFAGEAITKRTREEYLNAILRQNIAFFDAVGAGEVTSRITGDMSVIQDGISQKVGLTIAGISTSFAALAVGFARSWKLTLVMLSVTFVIILVMGSAGKGMKNHQMQANDVYASGATVAEEAFTSIRTTTAFGAQDRLAAHFGTYLDRAKSFDFKAKAFLAFMIAAMMAILNFQYALGFWAGLRFIHDGSLTVSKIITVIFSSMLAGTSIGHVAPHFGAFANAIAAGQKIFHVIDRKSPIDPTSTAGKSLSSVEGEITFKNVKHIYPSRPDEVVFNDLTLNIPAGKVTAVVGVSGSGKSTLVGLMERFYLPAAGEICLDGCRLQDLNLHWLRSQISLVSQEPILFDTTVYENIRFGLLGTQFEKAPPEKVSDLIETAARTANAYEFISKLPHAFQSRVGERGMLLSGGQKQRIAIARAVVSNPKILLLDEATAALDMQSENLVRSALEAASKNRTTLVIAHRLSTITNADNILVLDSGRLVEQGTHQELLESRGAYHLLDEAQKIQPAATSSNDSQVGERGVLDADTVQDLDSNLGRKSTNVVPPTIAEEIHYEL